MYPQACCTSARSSSVVPGVIRSTIEVAKSTWESIQSAKVSLVWPEGRDDPTPPGHITGEEPVGGQGDYERRVAGMCRRPFRPRGSGHETPDW